jgi:FRG domain
MMQHYGAPTTWLDFTRSPVFALWFAFESARSESRNDGYPKGSALWAIDLDWLTNTSQTMIDEGNPHVIVAETAQTNPRIKAQQGLLLSNRSKKLNFTECLLGMLLRSPGAAPRQVVSKVVLKRDQRIKFLNTLTRMGVYRTSVLRPDEKAVQTTKSVTELLRERLTAQWNESRESLKERMESRNTRKNNKDV